MAIRVPLLIPALPLLLAGCAAQGGFPSLAPRAVEGELSPAAGGRCEVAPVAVPLAPAVPIVDDPQLAARVAELVQRARIGEREFTEVLPTARRAASRAGSSGSEPWIEAQQLVSKLESVRSPTVNALAELDALSIARSQDGGTNQQDLERVLAALQQVRALALAQRAELDRLTGQLSAP